MAFDDPVAVQGVGGEERGAHVLTVKIGPRAGDAHDAAPRTFADELAQAQLAEAIGEEVAVGRGVFVDEADLRAVEGLVRHGLVLAAVARHAHAVDFTLKPFQDHGRNVAAAVHAVVDDERLLVELRVEELGEHVQALGAHVGDVDVADLSVRSLVHLLDVALDPFVVGQLALVRDRFYIDRAGVLAGGVVGNFQRDRFAGLADQRLVDVHEVGGRDAVHLGDVLSFPGFHARAVKR